jgi:hypothetical protein
MSDVDQAAQLSSVIGGFFEMMTPEDKSRVINRCQKLSVEAMRKMKQRSDEIGGLKRERDRLRIAIDKDNKEVRILTNKRKRLIEEANDIFALIHKRKKLAAERIREEEMVAKEIESLRTKSDAMFSSRLQKEIFNIAAFDDTSSYSDSFSSSSESSESSEFSSLSSYGLNSSPLRLREECRHDYPYTHRPSEDFITSITKEEDNEDNEDNKDNDYNDYNEYKVVDEDNGEKGEKEDRQYSEEYLPLDQAEETLPRAEILATSKRKNVYAKGKEKKKKMKTSTKGKGKEEVELTENPYTDFYISTHSFRGALCFHCGGHDESLMRENSVSDWNAYLDLPRQSEEWKAARSRLRFPSMCTCNCSICKQRPKHCTCEDMFLPEKCTRDALKDFRPKSKGEDAYPVTAKKYRELGIMDGNMHTLATNIRETKDPKQAVLLHDAFIYFWKRYLEHIHTRDTLAIVVAYVFIYSTICGRDKAAAPKRCVYGNTRLVTGNIQRGLCTRHKPQISQARVKKWTWISEGKKMFEEWKKKVK